MGATKTAGTYVGRIGGLAVALGVGAAIASGAGTASADTSGSSDSGSSSQSSLSGSERSAGTSKKNTTSERAPKKDKPESTDKSDKKSDDEPTASDDDKPEKPAKRKPATEVEPNAATDTESPARALSAPITVSTEPESTEPESTEPESVTRQRLAPRLLHAFGVSSSSTKTPGIPEAPAVAALLGFVRREVERTSTSTPTLGSSSATATYAAAAVVDPLPNRLGSDPVAWVTGAIPRFLDGRMVPLTQDTAREFNIGGTDLGIMWDGGTIDGKRFVHVAFGDTFADQGMTREWRNNALLISFDDRLDDGLGLYPTGPVIEPFIPAYPSEVGPFGSEVTRIPTAGININGIQYVNYMSVRSWDTPGRWTTNYSAISQFYPEAGGPGEWQIVRSTVRSSGWVRSATPYRAGDQNFQQMAYVLQPEDQVAEGEPRYLYAFGTPSGRAGSAYLSRVSEGDVTDLSQYEYWDGDSWVVGNAAVAKPVIGSDQSSGLFGFIVDWANDPNVFGGYLGGLFGPKTGGNVSEMSVQYNEYLDKYVVLYGDGNNNIQMRLADTPEGAWSDPVQLASSADYPGLYAPFIHPWSGTGLLENEDGDADYNNLYWNMSIWGDYNVVLMETDLSPLQTVAV